MLLDFTVLPVNLLVVGDDLPRLVMVKLQQRRHRPANGHADHFAHFQQRRIQLLQLHLIIFAACHFLTLHFGAAAQIHFRFAAALSIIFMRREYAAHRWEIQEPQVSVGVWGSAPSYLF